MHNTDDELLYTADVAEILRCDLRTVHRMAKDGRLPTAARGRGIRGTLVFRRSDVEAVVAQATAA